MYTVEYTGEYTVEYLLPKLCRELPAPGDVVREGDLLRVDGGEGIQPLLLHQPYL